MFLTFGLIERLLIKIRFPKVNKAVLTEIELFGNNTIVLEYGRYYDLCNYVNI